MSECIGSNFYSVTLWQNNCSTCSHLTSMVFLLIFFRFSRRSFSFSTVLVDSLSLSRSCWYVSLCRSSSSFSLARCSFNICKYIDIVQLFHQQWCYDQTQSLRCFPTCAERLTSSRLHSSSLCCSLASVASTCCRCLSLSLSQRCCSCRCWDCSLCRVASSSLCRARVRCFSCSSRTLPLWRLGMEARSVREALCSSMWLSCCDMMAWGWKQQWEFSKVQNI